MVEESQKRDRRLWETEGGRGIAGEVLKLLTAGIGMGWGPCLALSGPVLLPYIAATKGGWQEGLKVSALFSLGRIFGLAVLGGLASVAFASINRFFPPYRSAYLYLAMAIVIVLMGTLIVLGRGFELPLHRVFAEHLVGGGSESMLGLGFLIGISPCMPLVAVLTYIACTATNVLQGVVYAVSFGIGTVFPVMILGPLVGLLPGKIKSPKWLRAFRVVCGLILVLFGLQLLYSIWHLL